MNELSMPASKIPFLVASSVALLSCLPAMAQKSNFTILKTSLEDLRKNKPAVKDAIVPGSNPDRVAWDIPFAKADWKVQLVAAEWLLRAHVARNAMGNPVPDQADLLRAWQLGWSAWINSNIDVGASRASGGHQSVGDAQGSQGWNTASTEYKQILKWILAESAYRLKDPQKMAQAMDPLDLEETFLPREALWVMMCAFHSGRFKLAENQYKALAKAGHVSAHLRNQAITKAAAFDYTVLDRAAFPERKNVALTEMVSATFQVSTLDEAGESAASQESEPLFRLGVAGHWLMGVEGCKVPMSGSMDDQSVMLVGYGVPGSSLEGTTLSVELKPIPGQATLWKGTEERVSKAGKQIRKVTWEIRPVANRI